MKSVHAKTGSSVNHAKVLWAKQICFPQQQASSHFTKFTIAFGPANKTPLNVGPITCGFNTIIGTTCTNRYCISKRNQNQCSLRIVGWDCNFPIGIAWKLYHTSSWLVWIEIVARVCRSLTTKLSIHSYPIQSMAASVPDIFSFEYDFKTSQLTEHWTKDSEKNAFIQT